MSLPAPAVRQGRYAARGDYHRVPDRDWDFLPTYLAKLAFVRAYLTRLPSSSRVLDAGCGEGVLVEEFAAASPSRGSTRTTPRRTSARARSSRCPSPSPASIASSVSTCSSTSRTRTQPRALAELHRVLGRDGELVARCPTSRTFSRACTSAPGATDPDRQRQSIPGDRPAHEYLGPVQTCGLRAADAARHLPDRAGADRARSTASGASGARASRADAAAPVPGWCFLNLFVLRKP